MSPMAMYTEQRDARGYRIPVKVGHDYMEGDDPYGEEGGDMAVHTQVQCRKCAHYFRTRVRNNSVRCPGCSAVRWVSRSPVWEGPDTTPTGISTRAALTRPPVPMECRHCGREWSTTAASGNTLACPGCGKRVRVSSHARDVGYVPGARPMGKREHFARLGKPVAVARPVDDPDEDWDDGEDDYPRESAMDALRAAMEALTTARRSPEPAAPRRAKPVAPRRPVRTPHPSQDSGRRQKVAGRAPQDGEELDPNLPSLPWTPAPPAGVQACIHLGCDEGATFALAGPGYSRGVLMCRMHAEGEYRVPGMRVWKVTSW